MVPQVSSKLARALLDFSWAISFSIAFLLSGPRVSLSCTMWGKYEKSVRLFYGNASVLDFDWLLSQWQAI